MTKQKFDFAVIRDERDGTCHTTESIANRPFPSTAVVTITHRDNDGAQSYTVEFVDLQQVSSDSVFSQSEGFESIPTGAVALTLKGYLKLSK